MIKASNTTKFRQSPAAKGITPGEKIPTQAAKSHSADSKTHRAADKGQSEPSKKRSDKGKNTFKQALGKIGEALAADILTLGGWKIEALNFYAHRKGEIDIIGRPPGGRVLAFVEVKTRWAGGRVRDLDHPGQQAVHLRKQRRLKQTAMAYLDSAGWQAAELRFDLMLVDITLNYPDLMDILAAQDMGALRQHSRITHIADIMGSFSSG